MDNPIGFFDSGVGGTSIWTEVNKLLPNENTIYLADSKNAPYGVKSKDEIIALCKKNTDFLIGKRCKLIVVACNTATTNAITELRSQYKVPFIGIEPAIKPASIITKSNTIGVLATKGTITSQLFEKTSTKLDNQLQIINTIGTGLVELIENNQLESPKTKELLNKYLDPMLKQEIDVLVLGCSHYPYLIEQIKEIVGTSVTILDSGYAVAKQTQNILEINNLLNLSENKSSHQFYSNTTTNTLRSILNDRFLDSISYLDF